MIYTMQPHVVSKYSTHTEPRPFIFELKPTTSALPYVVNFITNSTYDYYNYNVDVDGVRIHTSAIGNVSITFTQVKTYNISISGIYPRLNIISSGAIDNSLGFRIKQWGSQIWRGQIGGLGTQSSPIWYRRFDAIDKPDLRLVDNLTHALANINQPSDNLNLSKWNVKYVTSFANLSPRTIVNSLNLSGWKTNNVTSMVSAFAGNGINNLDLTGWNTSNVTTMSNMFRLARIVNLNVNHFDVGKVQSFAGMFEGTYWTNMIELSNWKPTSLVTASTMFVNAVNNSNNTIELDRIYQNWAQYLPTYTSGTHILDFGRARCSNSVLSFRTQIINKGWTIYDDRSPRP